MSTRLINRRVSQRKVGSLPKKVLISAAGGQEFISGSYKYHVFTSSDVFTVFYKAQTPSTLYFDYLVVGGGQAGANGSENVDGSGGNGGSGGSGLYRTVISQSFSVFNTDTPYSVTIGGAGSPSTIATNASTITSAGGSTNPGGAGGTGETSNPTCTVPEVEGQDCTCIAPNYTVNINCTCAVPLEEQCDEYNQCVDVCPDGYEICDEDCIVVAGGDAAGYTCVGNGVFTCPNNCYQCAGNLGSSGGNGIPAFSNAVIFGGPFSSYAAGGGGGGGGGGNSGGLTGGSSVRGSGGSGGDPGDAGSDGSPNSGDGGGGGGGGDPCCNNDGACSANNTCNAKYGGVGGTGGSGIVYIKYLFEK